jgi:uncharacterized membrane protein YoaK (UPF0700 family)
MDATNRSEAPATTGAFGLALLLAALAGWVDAAGLAGSGGVFISFMSGNTTDFAVSLIHHKWADAEIIGLILALFVAGVAAGEVLEYRSGRPSLVLGLEAVFLAGGAAMYWCGIGGRLGLCPLVFAMGLQNATMHRAGGISIGLTYVTGTLVQIGRGLVGGGTGAFGKHCALWLSLAAGAALGGLALSLSVVGALLIAAAAAASLAVGTAMSRHGDQIISYPPPRNYGPATARQMHDRPPPDWHGHQAE